MEVYEIHGPRRMYWNTEGTNFFPAMNYGKIMSRSRFEELVRHMQLSFGKDDDKEISEFLQVVNLHFRESLTPGSYSTLDESIIKSFHRNLEGKIKIIREPRPIGNEIKNLSDAASKLLST